MKSLCLIFAAAASAVWFHFSFLLFLLLSICFMHDFWRLKDLYLSIFKNRAWGRVRQNVRVTLLLSQPITDQEGMTKLLTNRLASRQDIQNFTRLSHQNYFARKNRTWWETWVFVSDHDRTGRETKRKLINYRPNRVRAVLDLEHSWLDQASKRPGRVLVRLHVDLLVDISVFSNRVFQYAYERAAMWPAGHGDFQKQKNNSLRDVTERVSSWPGVDRRSAWLSFPAISRSVRAHGCYVDWSCIPNSPNRSVFETGGLPFMRVQFQQFSRAIFLKARASERSIGALCFREEASRTWSWALFLSKHCSGAGSWTLTRNSSAFAR